MQALITFLIHIVTVLLAQETRNKSKIECIYDQAPVLILPLKLGLRSPIHLLHALMTWGCDTFTLPLPRFHHFTFPTGSTLTPLLPIVTTLLLFYQMGLIWSPDVKHWYSPLPIFLNSLTYFSWQPFVLSARKVPVALKPFPERVFMSWYDEKKLSEKTWWSEGLAQGKSYNVTTL